MTINYPNFIIQTAEVAVALTKAIWVSAGAWMLVSRPITFIAYLKKGSIQASHSFISNEAIQAAD